MRLPSSAHPLLIASALWIVPGCGALSALIPDQNVSNPFKLQNTSQALTVSGSTVSATQTSAPFDNIGSLPVNPKDLKVDQALSPSVTVSGASSLPSTITLSNLSLTVTLTDAVSGGLNSRWSEVSSSTSTR